MRKNSFQEENNDKINVSVMYCDYSEMKKIE